MGKLIIILVIVVLLIVFQPWQSLQTYWHIPPFGEFTIHGHSCLSVAGAKIDLTNDQMIFGLPIRNASPYELIVTSCD